jgi:6-pyruvoyltetrahydropterin/6-carboxytetrahydropterin synthase
MQITRRLEFDAGHRLPNHKSQCRHLHGHRYAVEITVEAEVVDKKGSPDEGMVLDFSDVKSIAKQVLVDKWDHAFLAHCDDKVMVDFLAGKSGAHCFWHFARRLS